MNMKTLPSKHTRVHKEVEALVEKLAEITGYESYTVRNIALLLGLKKLAYLSKDQVKKGFPPTPFLTNQEFWMLHASAEKSIEELREAVSSWKERKVGVYA
jgi:tryptophan 2,3-dioxygenase